MIHHPHLIWFPLQPSAMMIADFELSSSTEKKSTKFGSGGPRSVPHHSTSYRPTSMDEEDDESYLVEAEKGFEAAKGLVKDVSGGMTRVVVKREITKVTREVMTEPGGWFKKEKKEIYGFECEVEVTELRPAGVGNWVYRAMRPK